MFHEQRFTGVIEGKLAPIPFQPLPTPRFFPPSPLIYSKTHDFHSLGCSSDLYVRARHGVSTFIVPSV